MYVSPPRLNPLRRLPVRAYRGPLPSRLPGLGQVSVFDPSQLPALAPAPVPVYQFFQAPLPLPASAAPGAPQTFTGWLNQNAKTAALIAGIAVGVLVLTRL